MSSFGDSLAIDLGTANTLIWSAKHGLLVNEPSVVAIRDDKNGKKTVVAVGLEAKHMLGKVPGTIQVIRPLKDGVIADFTVTEHMLKALVKRCTGKSSLFFPPKIVICVPSGSTQVERRAIQESAMSAGASAVYLIEETMASAIGAGLPVQEPHGSMIIDIGGGTTEIGIISLGGAVYSTSLRVGGDKFDESISNYIRREYGLVIGEATAERIKKEIGLATIGPDDIDLLTQVKGRDAASGLPKTIELRSRDISKALEEPLNAIVTAVKKALEAAPPELSADLTEHGLCLTGGGALLKNLDTLIQDETQLPVFIPKDPLLSVAIGCGKSLEFLDAGVSVFASSAPTR